LDTHKGAGALVIYICRDCGADFEVSERDGLTNTMEVACPACGSDLVAVDFAAVRRRRPREPRRPDSVGDCGVSHAGEAC
jgi:DNA-directed RNA polymerase subunit RPC12/RpoP